MAEIIRPRRSVLYMPGSNARALEKAKTLPADVLILDLEDAVAPNAKVAAREQAIAAVDKGGYGPREVVIRINGTATPWHADDLAAAAASAKTAASSVAAVRSARGGAAAASRTAAPITGRPSVDRGRRQAVW